MRILLAFLTCFAFSSATGQSLKQYEKAGDKAFDEADCNTAIQHYKTVLDQDKNNRFVQLKYAECAVEMNAYSTAEQMLKKLGKDKTAMAQFGSRYHFTLARALQGQGKYALALQELQKVKQDEVDTAKFDLCKESCQWALSQSTNEAFQVKHGGKTINSPYTDFGPALFNDTLYYSSYRFKRHKNDSKPTKKWTKVLVSSSRSSRPREATRMFKEQDSVHIAHTAFFPNYKYQIYTQCRDTLAQIRCDLYLAARDEKGQWTKGTKLPEGVNAIGYTSTQPHVAQIGSAYLLYFASDRPGGLGQLDLYQVNLDSDWFNQTRNTAQLAANQLPAFGKCVPLTTLNTSGNDVTPFVMTKSQQLWWSSDSRVGFGGYDVFYTQLDQLDKPEIKNPGNALNTSYHDLYFFADTSAKSGWMASNRPGSAYLDAANKACCFDLYTWSAENPKYIAPPKPLAPIPNTPIEPAAPIVTTPVPPTPQIPASPTPQEIIKTFVGLPLYFDNDEPDKRTRRTTTTKDYEATATMYLSREDEYRQKFAEGEKNEDAKANLENEVTNFFENEVRSGYDRLFELTDLIFERLEAGERIEVVVKGFTSPRAQTDYNLNLGFRRISSIRNHFERWNSGALKHYITDNQLIISQTSFGETTASAKASDQLNDEKNSIYNPLAARERRVEIVEIKTQ
jgi:outer membrane protein OmpA-like peptidoglycan-associated protein/tetratricopeptide (TPR) repeat protein